MMADDAPQSQSEVEHDPDEFRAQLLAVIPALRGFARGLCGNRELADDMAQDAMMRAWAAQKSFTPGTNFRAWIFMILRNQFYTTIRRNSRMVSWDPEVAERVLVEQAGQQDGLNLEDVAAALQKLPFEQREVLMLIGANGLSYEEAAEVMGCAIGTIKSRLARGRAALSILINGTAQYNADLDGRAAETGVTKISRGRQQKFGRGAVPGDL
ncbi:MAG: sigma-70 family RNA polymerase sigma factor [Sphingorhabdus sp.]